MYKSSVQQYYEERDRLNKMLKEGVPDDDVHHSLYAFSKHAESVDDKMKKNDEHIGNIYDRLWALEEKVNKFDKALNADVLASTIEAQNKEIAELKKEVDSQHTAILDLYKKFRETIQYL